MLVFDQLKKDDPQLRSLATIVFGGILILFAGLWWVQIVSSKYYQGKLETQSIRTVRIPAVRGKILDRDGQPLADSQPRFNVNLYLEELSADYQNAYSNALTRVRKDLRQQMAAREKQLHRKLNPPEKKPFAVTEALINQLHRQTRLEVTSNIVADLAGRMQQPIDFQALEFQAHYDKARALPMTILPNLTPVQVARFEEQSVGLPGVGLGIQSMRYYPNGSVAAHLLGYLVHNDKSSAGEVSAYNYRLEDYEGISGMERLFDQELRGTGGEKFVQVNNYGYRQHETTWSSTEPGQNIVLTIDLDIQKAADAALQSLGPAAHGAIVVLDVHNGDVLAMASAPSYEPNHFVQHPAPEAWAKDLARFHDEKLEVQMNHAMQGMYPPGSIFKVVTSMAALELGVLNPSEIYNNEGFIMVGKRRIKDTAPSGPYDFDLAFALSSNSYFITNGLKPGVLKKMVALGERLHLGERTGLIPEQEDRGYFPSPKDILSSAWRGGNTANLSIGQEKVAVTPLQIAVMIAAVANGGTVYYPRLISRIESNEPDQRSQTFPAGRVHDLLGVSRRTLDLVRQAMLADVAMGTGKGSAVQGFQIAGKTGTAEVEKNGNIDKSAKITWFASYAPYDNPRYAVVVMVPGGASGGLTCAPTAHRVYQAIQLREKKAATKAGPLAVLK